ncbi:hypothetical protein AN958_03524 [Leucoagaricus sp. SymC.cos]|nr:hypothetical protein AN958_03524 [Leucoagaricus sp. SymC.cos]
MPASGPFLNSIRVDNSERIDSWRKVVQNTHFATGSSSSSGSVQSYPSLLTPYQTAHPLPDYSTMSPNERFYPRPPPSYHTLPGYERQSENVPLLSNADSERYPKPAQNTTSTPVFVAKYSLSIILILIVVLALETYYIYATKDRQKHDGEEHERQRGMIQWGSLQKDKEPCISYGTARYQAYLEYIPSSWDAYTACKETPMNIHGREVLPTECRHIGSEMVGIWIIDFDEPSCKPWWRDTKDHGCTSRQSGIHRYEAHLEGYLEPNEYKVYWAEMCNTTPQAMFGHTYKSPTECAYWPKIGVYGFWDVPDEHCR